MISNRTKIASIYVCQINDVFVWSRTDDRVRIHTFQNETPLLVINWSTLSCAIVFTDPIAGNISISNARVHQLSLNFYRCDSDHKRKLFFYQKTACVYRARSGFAWRIQNLFLCTVPEKHPTGKRPIERSAMKW